MNKVRKISIVFLSLVIIIVLFCYLSARDTRSPNIYLIPEGYVGWIRVEYRVKNALPLPIDNGDDVLKIPRGGVLKTSSSMRFGTATDEFYYVNHTGDLKRLNDWGDPDNNDKYMMVWAGSYEPHGANEKYFIGNREQFHKADE